MEGNRRCCVYPSRVAVRDPASSRDSRALSRVPCVEATFAAVLRARDARVLLKRPCAALAAWERLSASRVYRSTQHAARRACSAWALILYARERPETRHRESRFSSVRDIFWLSSRVVRCMWLAGRARAPRPPAPHGARVGSVARRSVRLRAGPTRDGADATGDGARPRPPPPGFTSLYR